MSASIQLSTEQGFTIARLADERIEVSVVPGLGAKLVSLRLLPSGREWLWHPPGAMRLFQCPSDDYGKSSLVGVDECLPTIRACHAGGRDLPGHGEVWNRAWELDAEATKTGLIRTSLRLPVSPFTVIRTVGLREGAVVLSYELINHSDSPEPFLWALHPLLTYQEGDRLRVPEGTRSVKVETASFRGSRAGQIWPWPSPAPEVDMSELRLESDRAAAKIFVEPIAQGFAAIENSRTGEGLEVRWSASENPCFGFWLSRGAWSGYHHMAIEPSNAPFDSLAKAVASSCPEVWIQGKETRKWEIVLVPH